ncbi:DUF1206 domain-containing protein [Rhizobiaceae bacterium CRRU44]|uniref:DUF1206 domain-containing protein n=1 Tax=Ferranicluibacter rubi TaxID=2715133 RepID=A0AA43ZGZ6_9HYPH|nr:DUF1206 domain-containing protein [Ferranicluibacter rubi]NHT76916.1 DUF1206 domain-containing protein [Ferranicluibacter rubi]
MTNKFEFLARWGYAARGVVYITLGLIALIGSSAGEEASTHGALSNLLDQPFGRILLGTVAVGLVGHVLWRFAQALLNADAQENNIKGYLARAGNLTSGIVNGALALAAARLVVASGGGSESGGSLAAWLMQQPFGRILVGLLGLVIIAAGAVQAWRGISRKYRERLQLPADRSDFLGRVSVFGLAARGIVLSITGGFFVFAAFVVDSKQAGSIPEALDWVSNLPWGTYLYALAAAGLVAFGVYSFIEARYRRIDAPEQADIQRGLAKASSVMNKLP